MDSNPSGERKEKIGLAFFWLVVLAYGFFVPSIISWNTESHLYPAFAMVDHHTVRIDAYHQGLGDKSLWQGHYYSDKAPGLAFLAVPVYAVMRVAFNVKVRGFQIYRHRANYFYIPPATAYVRYGITYLLVSLPSAVLAVLLWLFLTRVAGHSGWSLLLAGTYALGTIAYVYSIWYFSHQLCAVLLFGAFLLLFYHARGAPPGQRGLLASAGAGLLAGYSIISEYPTAVIVASLMLYLAVVARDRVRAILAFIAGMVPSMILNVIYNLVAFGRPLSTGYMYVNSSSYTAHVHAGPFGWANPFAYAVQAPTLDSLWQITFGTFRGLFVLNPVLLLFVPGAVYMWRRRDLRPEWWLCMAVVFIYFLMDASRGVDANGWSGGASVASRHLTPVLPFMIVPMAFGFANRIFRILFVPLAAASVTIMFMTVSATYLFQFQDKNPLVNEVFKNFFRGQIETNWVFLWRSTLGLTGFHTLFPFFAVALLLIGRILWVFHARPPAAPAGPIDQPKLEQPATS